MSIPENRIEVYATKAQLSEAVARVFEDTIADALENRGVCTLVLAGGRTPRDVYARLAGSARSGIDWERVHLFWDDERTVPPDHPDSNYGMAEAALIAHIAIPDGNVHRIRGEIDPKKAAQEYSRVIRSVTSTAHPRFDLVLLGIGENGHTASLFPGTEAVTEQELPVTAVYVPELRTWRITLTLPIINAARRVLFMVSGRSKANIVRQLDSLDAPSDRLPASLVRPREGDAVWMLDEEAASLLSA